MEMVHCTADISKLKHDAMSIYFGKYSTTLQ